MSYLFVQWIAALGMHWCVEKLCNDPQLLYQLAQNKENLDDEKSVSKDLL